MATRWWSHHPACSIRYQSLHVSSSANDSLKKFTGAHSRRPHHSPFSHGSVVFLPRTLQLLYFHIFIFIVHIQLSYSALLFTHTRSFTSNWHRHQSSQLDSFSLSVASLPFSSWRHPGDSRRGSSMALAFSSTPLASTELEEETTRHIGDPALD